MESDQPKPAPSPSPSPSPSPEEEDPSPACDPAVPGPALDQQAPLTKPPVADRDVKAENLPPEPILPASIARAELRRRLIGEVWQLAGDAFRQLGREGIDPGAFDPWAGMPGAGDEGIRLLIGHVDRLLIGESPDVERARAVFKRRIAVAVAEGRAAKDGPTRRWVTPMRLWDPVSFAKGAETSPEQVRPRSAPARNGRPEQPSMPVPPKFKPTVDPVVSPEDRAAMLELADRLVANPDAAAAAELQSGRAPAHLPTAEIVKRFGDPARAGPSGSAPHDDLTDEKP